MKFKDILDILFVAFSLVVALCFGLVALGCYIILVPSMGVLGLFAAFLASFIPGFYCYGIIAAAVSFIRDMISEKSCK